MTAQSRKDRFPKLYNGITSAQYHNVIKQTNLTPSQYVRCMNFGDSRPVEFSDVYRALTGLMLNAAASDTGKDASYEAYEALQTWWCFTTEATQRQILKQLNRRYNERTASIRNEPAEDKDVDDYRYDLD